MIVKCDKCQTRFKIPDEKVTAKGVKVRCTRCSHTFRVARAPEPAPNPGPTASSPPTPSSGPDPFATFGTPVLPGTLEATRPGLFQEGIEASRQSPPAASPLQPVYSEQLDVPSGILRQPTRVTELPKDLLAPGFTVETPPGPLSDFEPTVPLTLSFPEPLAAPPPPPAAPSMAPPSATASAASLLGDLPPPVEDGGFEVFDGPLPDLPAPDGPLEVMTATVTGPYAAPTSAGPLPAASRALSRPSGRPEDIGMVERRRPGAVHRTLGLVLNLGLASVLLVAFVSFGAVYLKGGKLDGSVLSLEPIKALFAGTGDLVAVDVSNGVYDTRAGKPVFYVRGEVENRGDAPSGAKVTVELVDGALSVSRADVRVGASATPEELYAVDGAEEAAALMARLDEQALSVKPGERQPFVVVFYEYPPELAEYRLKLTVGTP